MSHIRRAATVLLVGAAVAATSGHHVLRAQQSSGAPSSYDAVTDRGVRTKPTLVRLGNAGFSFNDPVFGSRLWRVTDRLTRPGSPDRSFHTPSGTHQNEWSADGRRFYVTSSGGLVIPYDFDPATGTASRIDSSSSADGGLTLKFYIEPQFSYVDPDIIYGSFNGSGANLHTVDTYRFSNGQYNSLIDLETLSPTSLKGTFIGGIASSSGPTERLAVFFGGSSQDLHRYVVVFDRATPGKRRLLDTAASTLDGKRTNTNLQFSLHHVFIDRSGRFVMIYPTQADRDSARKAPAMVVWDLNTDLFTAMPEETSLSGGHDAFGFGVAVNKDCCTSGPWDAGQWQLRVLTSPNATRDLVRPLLTPTEVLLSDHPTWNNAQPDRLVPFISALYRYGANTVEWRPWDDEIVGIQTAPGDTGAEIWRFAHHRSDVRNDNDPTAWSFWYTPRPNVSPDGRWALFTSNWEESLGTDPVGAAGEKARQDVFLVQLRASNDAPAPATGDLEISTATLPAARRNQPYTVTLLAAHVRGRATWSITRGGLPTGLSLDAASGVISGTPTSGGTFFAVKVTDTAGTVTRNFALAVTR